MKNKNKSIKLGNERERDLKNHTVFGESPRENENLQQKPYAWVGQTNQMGVGKSRRESEKLENTKKSEKSIIVIA